MTDRFASTRPFAADVVLSSVAFMLSTVVTKGKGSLSVLGEFCGES
jgi:hypothetical protein